MAALPAPKTVANRAIPAGMSAPISSLVPSLRLQSPSQLEMLEVGLGSIWPGPQWGRAWCQVADRLDNLVARDRCYDGRAVPYVGA